LAHHLFIVASFVVASRKPAAPLPPHFGQRQISLPFSSFVPVVRQSVRHFGQVDAGIIGRFLSEHGNTGPIFLAHTSVASIIDEVIGASRLALCVRMRPLGFLEPAQPCLDFSLGGGYAVWSVLLNFVPPLRQERLFSLRLALSFPPPFAGSVPVAVWTYTGTPAVSTHGCIYSSILDKVFRNCVN